MINQSKMLKNHLNNKIMGFVLKMKMGKASFQNYIEMNKNVVGTNWEQVNKDRIHVGLKPFDKETIYVNEKTGEIK